jgi:GTP-binding protein
MQKLDLNKAVFLKSAFKPADLLADQQIELAFAGRSNVGKSSVINLLTRQKKLAKTSKTPGRTQSINYFHIIDTIYLVDLPGYGYAKVDQQTKKHWHFFLKDYIVKRDSLKGIFLIMDVRHPFTPLDETFLELCSSAGRPCHILLNKSDKLSNNELTKITQQIRMLEKLEKYAMMTWQFFSTVSGKGLEELEGKFNEWAHINSYTFRGDLS